MRLFKPKAQDEPIIEFLTEVPGMVELVPPVPARKMIPKWMKDTPLRCPFPGHGGQGNPIPLPSNIPDGITTIKACAGVMDIMKWGFVIPLWADHEMITYPDTHQTGQYQFKSAVPETGTSGFRPVHSQKMPLMEGEFEFSPKIDSPWLIRTPPGYSTAMLPLPLADDEFEKPWRIVPGIIDTDRYHSSNVLLKWRYVGRYLMEQGTPLCVVVPFKRTDAHMKHVVRTIEKDEAYRIKASGKGGTGGGNRFITMPYQKDRKYRELNGGY